MMTRAFALSAFVAMIGVTGCAFGYGNSMQRQGKATFAAGDYRACSHQYAESLKYWVAKAEKASPGAEVIYAGSIAQGYHGRGWCEYKQNNLAGAIDDITMASKHFTDVCKGGLLFNSSYRKAACKQRADDQESLALWKKELAGKSK